MYLRRPNTKIEALSLIGYGDMWPRRLHILAPLTESASGTKGRKILRNDALEICIKGLKLMVSAEMLLSYPYWKIPFTVHTDASDKQLGDVTSQKNELITFL